MVGTAEHSNYNYGHYNSHYNNRLLLRRNGATIGAIVTRGCDYQDKAAEQYRLSQTRIQAQLNKDIDSAKQGYRLS